MSYMLLVLQQPGEVVQGAEGRQRYDRMMGFAKDLAERGVLVSGESLGSDLTAVRVQKRNGRASAVDGPFAEAKEIVGGFFLLNCPTKAEAIAIAHDCPAPSGRPSKCASLVHAGTRQCGTPKPHLTQTLEAVGDGALFRC